MKKWIKINNFRDLYVEIVLVTFDVPLLFVCRDDFASRYLVLCVDEEVGEYLIAKSSKESLLEMLNNEVPMDELFKKAKEELILIKYDFKEKKFDFEYVKSERLTQDMLPNEGAYFELRNAKIEDYIKKLTDEELVVYNFRVKTFSKDFRSHKVLFCDEYTKDENLSVGSFIKDKRYYSLRCCVSKNDLMSDIQYDEELFESLSFQTTRRRKNICSVVWN